MRYRLLASYQGAPYEAGVGPTDTDVVLFAACPPPEDLRFEPATGHWRKHVRRDEVQTLHESRPVGVFRGERCIVLDELGDRLHIVYLGHDAYRAEELGYWEIDRGVFELVTSRQEVTDITEQRLPLLPYGDGASRSQAVPPLSGGPETATADPAPPLSMAPPATSSASAVPVVADPSLDGMTPTVRPVGYGRVGLGDTALPARDPLFGNSGGILDLPGSAQMSSVTMPAVDEPPLPLEAQARRAAAAGRSAKIGESGEPVPPAPAPPASGPQAPVRPEHVLAAPVPPDQPSQGAPMPPTELAPGQSIGLSWPSTAPHHRQDMPGHALPSWTPPTPVSAASLPGAAAHGPVTDTSSPRAQPQPLPDLVPEGLPDLPPEAHAEQQAQALPDAQSDLQAPSPPDLQAPGLPDLQAPGLPDLQAPGLPDLQAPSRPAIPAAAAPRRRRAARRRLPTQRIFSDLASQAAIPAGAFAIGDEVDGAMCLMPTDEGFEVFNFSAGARHEVRVFQDEESAYFYLFGILVAEAVRTGDLAPRQ